MTQKKNFNKSNPAEIRLYELLGIGYFRKLILCFERIRHIRDNGKNKNYHPADMTTHSLTRFSGYLIYNCALHIVSLLFTAFYFLMTRLLSAECLTVDIVMCLLTVFNIYCIMLQRYIFLRLRQHVCRSLSIRQKRRSEDVKSLVKKLRDKSVCDAENELALIRKMEKTLLSGEEMILGNPETALLEGIAQLCDEVTSSRRKAKIIKRKDMSLSALTELCGKAYLFGKAEIRASRLQSLLGIKGMANVMFSVCIITATADAEQAYRRIFCSDSYTATASRLGILSEAYESYLFGMVK